MSRRILYFDMDGVVSDLMGYLRHLINPTIEMIDPLHPGKDGRISEEQKTLQQRMFEAAAARELFWEELPVLPGSKEFYHTVKQGFDDVFVLSHYRQAIKEEKPLKAVREHKRRWFLKHIDCHIPEDHILVTDQPKETFMKENQLNLLIDDSLSNINRWRACGGMGVLHENPVKSIESLNALGFHFDDKVTISDQLRRRDSSGLLR